MDPSPERACRLVTDAVRSVVVVGAGLAGATTCAQLRAQGYDGRLVLIGAEEHLPYERPPLSKEWLRGRPPSSDLLVLAEDWFVENDVIVRLGERVVEVDASGGAFTVAGRAPEEVDAVVLATGGVPRLLGVPGAEHPAVSVLRTIEDAALLRERFGPDRVVGVVGAGLVGAEVAATAAGLGCEVVLVDPSARPLARAVGPWIADLLHGQHRRHGVRVEQDVVTRVHHGPGGDVILELARGTRLRCDVVVVGLGLDRSSGAGVSLPDGVRTADGVLVDDDQRSSLPRVLAVGDVSRRSGPGGPALPTEHWDGAVTDAARCAAALLGNPRSRSRRSGWFWSERYDARVEVVGELPPAGPDLVRGDVDPAHLSFAAVAVDEGRCRGAVTVNRPQEMAALRRIIDSGTAVDVDLLRDTSVDLRALARRPRS